MKFANPLPLHSQKDLQTTRNILFLAYYRHMCFESVTTFNGTVDFRYSTFCGPTDMLKTLYERKVIEAEFRSMGEFGTAVINACDIKALKGIFDSMNYPCPEKEKANEIIDRIDYDKISINDETERELQEKYTEITKTKKDHRLIMPPEYFMFGLLKNPKDSNKVECDNNNTVNVSTNQKRFK